MKVLVVGGGGREHTLVWKIAQSSLVDKIFAAPGNAGIAGEADCLSIDAEDISGLVNFAAKERIDLTVVGPEAPLAAGVVDAFRERRLKIFGPPAKGARLEASKVFAKELMRKSAIPTADFCTFTDPQGARNYIEARGAPIVVKADGLAAGKGSLVCRTVDEALDAVDKILVERAFGDAGNKVVVEECLTGEEASIIAFTDGKSIYTMESAQDHKPVFDGDRGPNTGGMGAYSPAPVVTDEVYCEVEEKVLVPVVHALGQEGVKFRGVIYAGLMITAKGARVMEFNVRFGDPESQPQLIRLKSDLVPVLLATIEGRLEEVELVWDERPAVCVVMASGGYPGSYEKGKVITGLDEVAGMEDVVVFHAGTALKGNKTITNGGRVLGVTALGASIEMAIKRVYEAVEKIHFDGAHFRRDIGAKAILRLKYPFRGA